jgi:hypothetical protein
MHANATDRRIEPAENAEDVLGDLKDNLELLIPAKPAAEILGWHVATFYRACFDGMGPKKRRCLFVKRGRQTCTTRAWIAEFLEGLTRDHLEANGEVVEAPVRSPARRRKAIDRARAELAEMGV